MIALAEDTLPPFDREAEAALIGVVMSDNGMLADAIAIVPDPEMFFGEAHAIVWRIIVDMFNAGRPVDGIVVSDELHKIGRDDLARYDGQIFDCDGFMQTLLREGGLSWHAPSYAQRVRDSHLLRETIQACNAAMIDAYAHRDEPGAVLVRTEERLRSISRDHLPAKSFKVGELLPEVYARVRDRGHGMSSGVRTGFSQLDDVTDGFQAGELVVLGARPSMGKTSWALNMLESVSVDGNIPSLFVSLEMSNPLLAERLLGTRAQLDSRTVRCGRLTDLEWTRVDRAFMQISEAPLYLVRRPGRTASQIASEVRLSHARDKIQIAVVDYLQLMQGDSPRDNDNTATGKITQLFKALAADLGIPIVVLSQLNRDLERREDKRPKMADLRNSGSIEQDADLVLLLHRPEYFDPTDKPGLAEMDLAKNRNGTTGVISLEFEKSFMRFRDWCPESTPGPAPY